MNTYLLSTLGEIALGQGNLEAAEQRFKAGLAWPSGWPCPSASPA